MENKTAEEILKRATMPNISVNAQFDAILSAMEAYAEQYKSKWIRVEDELPPVCTSIDTYYEKTGPMRRYFSKAHESYTLNMWVNQGRVTHMDAYSSTTNTITA